MGTLWIPLKTLFTHLGNETVVPPPITRRTIEIGNMYSPEYACLPLKINVGNFVEALEMGADTIVMGGGTGPCRFGYYAQVEREILKELGATFRMIIIEPPQGNWAKLLQDLKPLNNRKTWNEILYALRLAWLKLKSIETIEKLLFKIRPLEKNRGSSTRIFQHFLQQMDKINSPKEIKEAVDETKKKLQEAKKENSHYSFKIALVGEIYMLNEPEANKHIEKKIGEMGGYIERNIFISEWIKDHLLKDPFRFFLRRRKCQAAKPYLNHFVGGHGLESVGESVLFSRKGFDGIIHIMPFTCTPEVIAQTCFPRVMKDYNIPILSLSLDEHAAEAGLMTRLEAFIDLIMQRKSARKNILCKSFHGFD